MQITNTLRAAIVAGELRPGVVYSAPALAAQFGVSATPVREAMLHLAKEDLIEIVRNKGFRVSEPSERDLDEIVELRQLLEVPTIGKLARRGVSRRDLAACKALATETVRAAKRGDVTGHVEADIAFHLELLGLWGNDQLVETIGALRSRSRLYGLGSPAKAERLVATSREHVELVELIAAKEARAAEKLMTAHISYMRSEWRRPG